MERALGGLERQFYQQNLIGSTHMCAHLRIEGVIDRDRLLRAHEALALRYPLLRASVVHDPFLRFSLEGAPLAPYHRSMKRDSDDQWRRELEKELSRSFGPGQGLAFLTLISDDQGSDLLYTVNHCLADGLSLHLLCRTLLDLYNGANPGQAIDRGPMEPRFPKEYRGFRGWWRAFKFIFALAKLGPALQLGLSDLTVNTLSAGFTFDRAQELNARARSRGSNLFAVFSAVALQSIYELYGTAPLEALSLNTPVSLRPSLDVDESEIGVFLAGHMALYKVSAETDTWELARLCFETLKQGIAEGRPYLLTLLARGAKKPKAPKVSARTSTHRPTISISNLGRVDNFPALDGARVTAHRMVSAQSAKDPFALVLVSYQGRLNVDIQYSREKMGTEAGLKILETIHKNLHKALN